ncbi:MAG: hypothetical protein WKF70_04060, partial [Chitinophagaceae bacterium]
MAPLASRRNFITHTAKAGLGLYVGSAFLSSCATPNSVTSARFQTGFKQEPLPYSYNALNEA